ncbi:MAG: hypothetical protein IJT38_02870 [Clostridia bacterium]|nr:hypothetical protein [Clostridia bacterium]
MLKFRNYFKRIAGAAVSAAVVLSTMTTFAAGNITWQVKDYAYNGTGFSIIYEQYLDGVATGYVVSGTEAGKYGLKTTADKVTRPVTWYDVTYPNYQYEEIWADGQYTGLVSPTGARLPETAYKNFRYMWEVGGTHKEIAETRAKFGISGDDALDYVGGPSYPKVYTGTNANVKEENKYYGFDVFEVYASDKARDTEVVLDKTGNAVNTTNTIKENYMTNAANKNEAAGSITGLVNSGSGVNSVLYKILENDFANTYAGQRGATDVFGVYHEVPVFDYTGYAANYFDNKLPIQHYFNLSGPRYDAYGNVKAGQEFGLSINVYNDCVTTAKSQNFAGPWNYTVNTQRYSYYTNNIITTHATEKAVTRWEYAGWELSEPYRMFEYLSIEGITFDGDIDNDGVYDTPVIFRYLTGNTGGFALANPKVEWKYAWAEASYPHEIYAQKFVEDMNGSMVATNDFRGMGKYAKENMGTEINPSSTELRVPSGSKNYQMRLEWKDNGILYVTPYYDVNEYAGEYVELSQSPDPSYIAAYDYSAGAPVFLNPDTVANRNK